MTGDPSCNLFRAFNAIWWKIGSVYLFKTFICSFLTTFNAILRNMGSSIKIMKFGHFLAQSNAIYSATNAKIKNRFFAFSPQFSPLSVGASFISKAAVVFSKIWRHLISATLLYIIDMLLLVIFFGRWNLYVRDIIRAIKIEHQYCVECTDT